MNVFFDVQGTLVSGGRSRPHARDIFLRLVEMGHHVYLWSSGGSSYAASAARLLDVEDLVSGCFGKSGPPPVSVDFVVDDQPGIVAYYGGYTVSAFAGDQEDRDLLSVPGVVESRR
ncbi:MAG TPA: hypothetical protein VJ827_09050 [Rubrobacter sp.]|nr:hypothetical protein [Rubrobacter sp.]